MCTNKINGSSNKYNLFHPQVPIFMPIIVFLFAVTLVVVPVVDSPQIEFLYATLIMLSGLIFYIPIVIFDKRAGCMRKCTCAGVVNNALLPM